MKWFRIFHGLPLDARLGVVARRSGLSRAEALSLYLALFDHASRAARRGSVAGFDAEQFAVSFDCQIGRVEAALAACRDKGMIDEAERLVDWARQVLTPAERMQAHRLRKQGVPDAPARRRPGPQIHPDADACAMPAGEDSADEADDIDSNAAAAARRARLAKGSLAASGARRHSHARKGDETGERL